MGNGKKNLLKSVFLRAPSGKRPDDHLSGFPLAKGTRLRACSEQVNGTIVHCTVIHPFL